MILYLLLVVFCGLISVIAFGLTIGGLVKKKRTLWISSLSAFVIFVLLTVFTGYVYVKKTIDYMDTDEFQAETKKKAESMGKTWGNTVSGTAQGLESTLDEEAITKLAKKSSTIVGNSVKASAEGFDESVGKTLIFSDESVEASGIIIGRAERVKDSAKACFGVYIEFKKDVKGNLALTSYDSKGLKMDNSILSVNEKAGTSKVFVFKFNYFEPGLSGYCILSKQKI